MIPRFGQPLPLTLVAALIAGWTVWCACGDACLPGVDPASHAAVPPDHTPSEDHDCCASDRAGADSDDAPAPTGPPPADCPHCGRSMVNGWLADEPLHLSLNDHGPLSGYLFARHTPRRIASPSITLSSVDQSAMPPPRGASLRDLSCLLQV